MELSKKWMEASVLRPTQITVGLVESKKKRQRMELMSAPDRREWLAEHPVPAVIAPSGKRRIFDHHHLARAVMDGGFGCVLVDTVDDFSKMSKSEFWAEMVVRHWAHPHGASGELLTCESIPKCVSELIDDPYRSLAGLAREAGAYAKTQAPFAEFTWADFFRANLPGVVSGKHFESQLAEAILLARCELAAQLPGFIARAANAPPHMANATALSSRQPIHQADQGALGA